MHSGCLSDPISPPPFQTCATMGFIPEEICLFRRTVLDECYQSRFWARALEFYLLDNVTHASEYRCLMASCPQQHFKDPRDMLRHLKKCDFFPEGKFWCPTCNKVDSFKVVSKKKCSWDRVNLARKLIKNSLKILQNIAGYQSRAQQALSGSLCANCLNTISPNGSVGSNQDLQSKFPTPSTGFDFRFYQPEDISSFWELPGNAPPSELGQMFSLPDGMVPETPAYQTSPSELSAGSLGHYIYPSDITPASAAHTNNPPVLGSLQFSNNNPVATPPTLAARQENRRSQIPSLTVVTHQSTSSMPAPVWGFNVLLDEGETLDPLSGIDSQGMFNSTPKIITPQGSEDAPSVPNGSLISPGNTHTHPSPSLSFLSSSNFDFSPSSMSSTPELQCDYAGCDFKPTGKNLLAYLRKHMKVHKKQKIPCRYCRETFSRRDNLTAHIRRTHADVVGEPVLKRRRENSGSPRPRAR